MELSIIVPVYNEVSTIQEILRRVLETSWEKEVVMVDDCSTDGTRDILATIADPRVHIYYHDVNKGKGAAIHTALQHVGREIVLIQDADLEYNPEDYGVLLKPLEDGRADVVYGSRFLGVHRAFLFWHYMGNRLLTLITNVFYNTILTDMETGYKAFRVDVIRGMKLRANRFDFEPEITAKILKRKYKIYEVPISYSGRDFDEGKKITWRDGFAAVYALIKYRFVD